MGKGFSRMTQLWKRKHATYLRISLVIGLLLQMFGFLSVAEAEEEGGAGTSAPAVSITFDVYSNISEANLALGGGSSALSLDSAVYRGDTGKSVKISGRTQPYNRVKIPYAFEGLDMQAGKHYNISMWAKVGTGSSVTN